MNISLAGMQAIICGSTQGIGLAIAKELALLGANCNLLARNENALVVAVQQLHCSSGQQHGYLVGDFSDPQNLKKVIEGHLQKNKVHILINNSGGPASGPIVDATEDAFLQAFNQHIICNQILTTACLPAMKNAKYGRIINVISTSVKIPLKNLGVSNTIRAAVASWAKTMSNELAVFNITVNNVLPGFTSTQRLDSLINQIAERENKDIEGVKATMQEEIPMKRFGDAAEIAAVAAFLASPAASYVTGVSIPVDGGRTGSI